MVAKMSKREDVWCIKKTRTYSCEKKKYQTPYFWPLGGLPFILSIIPSSMVWYQFTHLDSLFWCTLWPIIWTSHLIGHNMFCYHTFLKSTDDASVQRCEVLLWVLFTELSAYFRTSLYLMPPGCRNVSSGSTFSNIKQPKLEKWHHGFSKM